jgi:hypothetical protein
MTWRHHASGKEWKCRHRVHAATLSPRTLTAPSSYSKVNMSCPVVSADLVSVKVFRKYLRSGEGPHAQPEPREVTQHKSTRYMTVAGPRGGVQSSAGRVGSRGGARTR